MAFCRADLSRLNSSYRAKEGTKPAAKQCSGFVLLAAVAPYDCRESFFFSRNRIGGDHHRGRMQARTIGKRRRRYYGGTSCAAAPSCCRDREPAGMLASRIPGSDGNPPGRSMPPLQQPSFPRQRCGSRPRCPLYRPIPATIRSRSGHCSGPWRPGRARAEAPADRITIIAAALAVRR